jgi:hypothetical protein
MEGSQPSMNKSENLQEVIRDVEWHYGVVTIFDVWYWSRLNVYKVSLLEIWKAVRLYRRQGGAAIVAAPGERTVVVAGERR